MTSLHSFVFDGATRIGNDPCGITEKDLQNQKKGSYITQNYFEKVTKEYVSRRNILISELKRIKGVKVANPKGAFYCVAELPVDDADHFAQWMLEKFDHKHETLMVAPASGFYSTKGEGKNQIRLAYVLNKVELIRCVEILKMALMSYQK